MNQLQDIFNKYHINQPFSQQDINTIANVCNITHVKNITITPPKHNCQPGIQITRQTPQPPFMQFPQQLLNINTTHAI